MSKKAEERAFAYQRELGMIDSVSDEHIVARRMGFYDGYRAAEKDLGWISVKDKLPEKGHFVLTCVSDTGTPQCVGMALLLKDGTWWDGDIKVCVDYWMEVPKLKK